MRVRFALVISLLLLAACTSVPFDYPKTTSTAMPSDPVTPLGTIGADWQQEHADLSGFLGESLVSGGSPLSEIQKFFAQTV